MYVLFEGVDGSGKTSVMAAASKLLLEAGVGHVVTKEPGGPEALYNELADTELPYGARYPSLREMCVNNLGMPGPTKRALFKADSLWNWAVTVKPALDGGLAVLSDRGWLSDLVYGSVHGGLDVDDLYAFNTALCKEQAAATYVILVVADREARESRLKATNEYDLLRPEVRDALEQAYLSILYKFIPEHHFFVIKNDRTLADAAELAASFIINLRN